MMMKFAVRWGERVKWENVGSNGKRRKNAKRARAPWPKYTHAAKPIGTLRAGRLPKNADVSRGQVCAKSSWRRGLTAPALADGPLSPALAPIPKLRQICQ